MKIIITESQYNFLLENSFEKNSKLLYKMWDDGMEFNEISDYTGLSLEQIIFYLKDKKMPIDCSFANQLVGMLYREDLVNKKHSFENISANIKFSWDFFTGAVDFEYHDPRYKLIGFATPYWNGECRTPVDGSYFEDKREEDLYYDAYDNQGLTTRYTPESFKSISELIDFLNYDYPKLLIEPIEELLKHYDER